MAFGEIDWIALIASVVVSHVFGAVYYITLVTP